ncbi:Uma2 family endonuclease [Nocardia sp. NPDC059177]|uniref:Uma2 family endonuclease n=1 Tax=Nocardia sp. NPDC059177 TaxID=3346759 RepID=UPI00367953C6
MPVPSIERPDLPERMTWEELENLPAEVAAQIELWEGRVVWVRRGPGEHQMAMRRMTEQIERCARDDMSNSERCWRVNLETNVFFGNVGKSDFVTPDFLVHRCLPPFADVRATDTLLVGEVLSPSNTQIDIEAKRARYAGGGIPWYWEVTLHRNTGAIGTVRAYGLDIGHAELPQGVRPLRPANYVLAGEWTSADTPDISFPYPFPIDIPWSSLSF